MKGLTLFYQHHSIYIVNIFPFHVSVYATLNDWFYFKCARGFTLNGNSTFYTILHLHEEALYFSLFTKVNAVMSIPKRPCMCISCICSV